MNIILRICLNILLKEKLIQTITQGLECHLIFMEINRVRLTIVKFHIYNNWTNNLITQAINNHHYKELPFSN